MGRAGRVRRLSWRYWLALTRIPLHSFQFSGGVVGGSSGEEAPGGAVPMARMCLLFEMGMGRR